MMEEGNGPLSSISLLEVKKIENPSQQLPIELYVCFQTNSHHGNWLPLLNPVPVVKDRFSFLQIT